MKHVLPNAPYLFVASLVVDNDILEEVINFMSDTQHFKTMHRGNNYFMPEVFTLNSPGVGPDEGKTNLTYIHGLENEEKWKSYEGDNRPAARQEFNDKLGAYIKAGKIRIMQNRGYSGKILVQVTD